MTSGPKKENQHAMSDSDQQVAPSEPAPPDQFDGQSQPAKPRKPKANRSSRRKSGNRPVNREGMRIDRSGPRHQARIFAMQSLFEHDMTDHELPDILTRLTDEEGEDLPQPVADHAIRLVHGVRDRLAEIDPYITVAAPAFPIPQLASIDRSVLRLAVYELLFERDVPYRAVINEAVEIAKRYGGPSSGRFVNGVLGTIVDRIPESPATN